MRLLFGEVVLVRMNFHQTVGGKVRPAVVLLDTGDDDFVIAPITSRGRDTVYDFPIRNWSGAGLNVPSWIRIHKLGVQPRLPILGVLGGLRDADLKDLRATVSRTFQEQP